MCLNKYDGRMWINLAFDRADCRAVVNAATLEGLGASVVRVPQKPPALVLVRS